jgi:hypothetical protein
MSIYGVKERKWGQYFVGDGGMLGGAVSYPEDFYQILYQPELRISGHQRRIMFDG